MASATYTTLKTLNAAILEAWGASLSAMTPDRRRHYQARYEALANTRDIIRAEAIVQRLGTYRTGCRADRTEGEGDARFRMSTTWTRLTHNLNENFSVR